jgi:ABC-type oligopeptide transport system substrate-binding subunit
MPVGYIGWFMDYPDPSNVFEPLLTCAGSFNPGGYCNEALDAEFAAAKLLPPGDDRWAAFAALEASAYADLGNLNLVHVRNFYYTSARVENLIPDPATLVNFEVVSVSGN